VVQVVPTHTPLQQLKPQQSLFDPQAPPFCRHAPHFWVVLMHRSVAEQQSVSAVHAWDVDAQQVLAVQALPLQQVAWLVQPPPIAVHGEQVPLSQMLEQQSLASVQFAASCLHVPQTLS
jgi:hypothetical protein